MKRCALIAFLIAFPAALFATPTERYIVVTRHPFAEAARTLRNDNFDPTPRRDVAEFRIINGFAADLSDNDLAKLKQSSEVDWIEPVIERHALADSVQPGQQTTPYGVSMVNAPAVWPVTRGLSLNGGPAIHVAVIDTGVDYNSPELRFAFKGGFNFIASNTDPLDDFGHGTHVAGIIAAADDNEGVVGVAPGVDLYALKVLDQCGSGNSENVLRALDWVMQKKSQIGGNWILNLSLGSPDSSSAEQAAFQRASDAGLLIFGASGNSFDPTKPDAISYPGGYPSVISVGAIDSGQKVASFSQRGPLLKVVAPGVSVLSTIISASVMTNDGRQFAGASPVIVKDDQGTPLDGYCLPSPNVSGNFVFCGRGNSGDFPSDVKGKIALIERGDIKFILKAQNAQAAGATAVIVYDNIAEDGLVAAAFGNFTTASAVPTFLPFLFISQADGKALRATPDATVSLGFGYEGWALESGTSMSTPHAAGVGALVWAVAPNATATAVGNALIDTAKDLGDPGVDNTYGHGLVSAIDAAKQLNPAAFGPGGTPPPPPPTGRIPGRRGH